MRLTVVSYSRRRIGGIEQNLDVVLPELERRGHTLQFVYFHDEPADRVPVRTGIDTELLNVGVLGESGALDRVRSFRPDLINVHGDINPQFQTGILRIGPAAYSVHNYYGTCISGLKTHQFPVIQPCHRTFGPACLLEYFPRGCGGRNPLTMVRRYRFERARLAAIGQYDAVITHSAHMEAEYMRHGIQAARVHGLPYEVVVAQGAGALNAAKAGLEQCSNLLFVGRMDKLKGGGMLIDALPEVSFALRRALRVHFTGQGPAEEEWRKRAARVMTAHPGIDIQFHGWRTGADLEKLFVQSHLLVLPSLSPEPFGKVGPEAATYGIPVAAFAVGGISEWMIHGENGMFAPGDPPTAAGLAHAIMGCIADPREHRRLSEGALASASRFDLRRHVDRLLDIFEKVRLERSGFPAAILAS